MGFHHHDEYRLVDGEGSVWCFRVPPHPDSTVKVRAEWNRLMPTDCIMLLHEREFNNELLSQLPWAAVQEEFALARLFSHNYSFVQIRNSDNPFANTITMGVVIKFKAPHYSVELERGDARRLWGFLKSRVAPKPNFVNS